jgi:uncharacterized SAM-binding protein YcdF (DUF218 family)
VAYKLLAAALMPINVILVLGAAALVLAARRRARAGKAPVVLASGGAVPWTSTSRPESEAMAALLVEWGVPRTAILVDARSRTTRENAVEAERILTVRGAHRESGRHRDVSRGHDAKCITQRDTLGPGGSEQ